MSNYQRILAQDMAERVRRALVAVNAIRDTATLYVWPRDDRLICAVDPLGIANIDRLLSERIRHQIQAVCQGRRVVLTNHRGAFIQIAYHPEPHVELSAAPIDWPQQPSPLHVPIGATRKGPLWLSIADMDAVLIGGARRMGKSRLLHAWIRALQRGGAARLVLWDGKDNLEFGRYAGEGAAAAAQLSDALAPVVEEARRREALFRATGVSSLKEYNARAAERLPVYVLVVDEVAFVPEAAQPVLADLVARCGAYGIHPVFATQRPDATALRSLVKANLSTRIAFPVPSHHDSVVILGCAGAEHLPKTPGRLLLAWQARHIEAQTFRIELDDAPAPAPGGPAHDQPAPVISSLTRDERRMVEAALAQCQGFFHIKAIAAATSISHKVVSDVARRWELCQWLTPVQTTAEGRRLGRKVTPDLARAAGLGGLVDQVDGVDQANPDGGRAANRADMNG
jgi:hypothetical protein